MKSRLKPAILTGAAMSPVAWGLAPGHDDNYVPGTMEQLIGVETRKQDAGVHFELRAKRNRAAFLQTR